MNYRLVAIEIGEKVKYNTSVNEIGRIAGAIIPCGKDTFPNESITSVRAQTIYDWICSLARLQMESAKRNEILFRFCLSLCGEGERESVLSILEKAGIKIEDKISERRKRFLSRGFHQEVVTHGLKLFLEENFNHSVFEVCKAFNRATKAKAQSNKDGQGLMLEVWGWEKGFLKLTPCISETDKNIQEGMKFMTAGIMQAIRNPTAHEPVLFLRNEEKDCLDVLGFLSFLFRQLDMAIYFNHQSQIS